MKSQFIPIQRDLVTFHQQAKGISAKIAEKTEELKEARIKLLAEMKKLQELKCFTSITSGFFLKLSITNFHQIIQLPFIKSDKVKVSDRLVEMNGLGSLRTNITKLLKEMYSQLPNLTCELAKLNFSSFKEDVPYLPAGIKTKDFFVSSTIPAIFGFYWNYELKKSFLSFIINIAKNIQDFNFQIFQQHWLFDCVKNYIHATGIGNFLKISIGDIIYKIVSDKEIQKLSKLTNEQQNFFNSLSNYAEEIIKEMQNKIDIFPNDVFIIIKEFSNIPESEEEKKNMAQMIFLDCIIVPALSNSIAYNILPSNYYLDFNPFGPSRCLTTLAQLFRFIMFPNQLKLRYLNVDATRVSKLPYSQFIEKLMELKALKYNGLKQIDSMYALGSHFMLTTFSLPDILLLADTFQIILTKGQLLNISKMIPTDQQINYDFFRYEIWDLSVFGLNKIDIPDDEIEKTQKNQLSLTGEALYKYLVFADVDEDAPNGYQNFVSYHENNMILQHNFIAEAYLRNLYVISQDIPSSEQHIIIPALEEELRRRNNFINYMDESIYNILSILDKMKFEYQKVKELTNYKNSVLSYQILTLFVQDDPNIFSELQSCKNNLLSNNDDFVNFMNKNIQKISEYVSNILPKLSQDSIYRFHSYIMQYLNIEEFQEIHKDYLDKDKMILKLFKGIQEQPTQKIKFIIDFYIRFLSIKLNHSKYIGIPIEAAYEISETISLIKNIYKLEYNEEISVLELNQVIKIALMKSEIECIYSFSKYLEFSLIKLNIIDDSTIVNNLFQFIQCVSGILQL